MKQVILQENLKPVSTIGIGCMRIASMNEKEADTFIHTALDASINFFDEADIYGGGKSEEVLGTFLHNSPSEREKIFIQSKCGIRKGFFDFSKEHILSSVDGILSRLHTDHLDSLLLHRPDILMDVNEVQEAFDELYQSGKVLAFGVSNMSSGHMSYLSKYIHQKLITNQLQVSCAHTPIIDALLHVDMHDTWSVDHDGGVLPYMMENGISLQCWSPLQKGYFEGVFLNDPEYKELNDTLDATASKYKVEKDTIAYAWLLKIPCSTQVITGTTKPERILSAAKAMDIDLTKEEWYQIYTNAGNILP